MAAHYRGRFVVRRWGWRVVLVWASLMWALREWMLDLFWRDD